MDVANARVGVARHVSLAMVVDAMDAALLVQTRLARLVGSGRVGVGVSAREMFAVSSSHCECVLSKS